MVSSGVSVYIWKPIVDCVTKESSDWMMPWRLEKYLDLTRNLCLKSTDNSLFHQPLVTSVNIIRSASCPFGDFLKLPSAATGFVAESPERQVSAKLAAWQCVNQATISRHNHRILLQDLRPKHVFNKVLTRCGTKALNIHPYSVLVFARWTASDNNLNFRPILFSLYAWNKS